MGIDGIEKMEGLTREQAIAKAIEFMAEYETGMEVARDNDSWSQREEAEGYRVAADYLIDGFDITQAELNPETPKAGEYDIDSLPYLPEHFGGK